MRNGFLCCICGKFVRKENLFSHLCIKKQNRETSAFNKSLRYPLREEVPGKTAFCELCQKKITRSGIKRHLHHHERINKVKD